jgi:hypothetical protein
MKLMTSIGRVEKGLILHEDPQIIPFVIGWIYADRLSGINKAAATLFYGNPSTTLVRVSLMPLILIGNLLSRP